MRAAHRFRLSTSTTPAITAPFRHTTILSAAHVALPRHVAEVSSSLRSPTAISTRGASDASSDLDRRSACPSRDCGVSSRRIACRDVTEPARHRGCRSLQVRSQMDGVRLSVGFGQVHRVRSRSRIGGPSRPRCGRVTALGPQPTGGQCRVSLIKIDECGGRSTPDDVVAVVLMAATFAVALYLLDPLLTGSLTPLFQGPSRNLRKVAIYQGRAGRIRTGDLLTPRCPRCVPVHYRALQTSCTTAMVTAHPCIGVHRPTGAVANLLANERADYDCENGQSEGCNELERHRCASRCYGCWERSPRQGGRDPELMDLRTGHRYCHECMEALITWELDGCPDDPDLPYAGWLADA